MDLKLIKELLDMISSSDVDQVTIEEGEFKIKIKKSPEMVAGAVAAPVSPIPTLSAVPAPAAPAAAPAAPAAAPAPAEETGDFITSPIVGTFYRAASPDADPFVSVGSRVSKGDTLCIVEAMKIMNEIESDVSGTITKILVDNAQPVEYGQNLFVIDPS